MARFEGASLASCAHTYTLQTGVQSYLIFVIFGSTRNNNLLFGDRCAIHNQLKVSPRKKHNTTFTNSVQCNAVNYFQMSERTLPRDVLVYQKHAFHACIL